MTTKTMTTAQAKQNMKNWHKTGELANEPCTYGHLGCSTSGKDEGPCLDESLSTLESSGIEV